MPRLLRLLILPVLFLAAVAQADEALPKILIADPFIELHTGPGRGYPIFHVAERGQEVEIVKRRTDWFMVRTSRGVEGFYPEIAIRFDVTEAGAHHHVPLLLSPFGYSTYRGS